MEALDFIEKLETENENISKITNKLFTVYDVAIKPKTLQLGDSLVVVDDPKTKIIYTDSGKYLGTVGHIYESLQPKAFLNSIIESVETCDVNFNLDNLKYKCFADGKIIEFRLDLDIVSFKNRLGKMEEIPLFLNFQTGFGGKSRSEIGIYSKRLICSNGLKIIESEIELKAKHTVNMNAKVISWCDEIYKAIEHSQNVSGIWQKLDKIDVSVATVNKFAQKLAGLKPHETIENLSTRKKNILDDIKESIDFEFQRTGATAFGLLQGATYFTNHKASGHSEEYVNVRQGKKTNDLAQKLVMQMV